MSDTGDVTHLLGEVSAGAPGASDRLYRAVYEDLRRVASARMAAERDAHTLQPTALVNEAYLRLIGPNQPAWQNRRHFFAAAAEAMRRILIDEARRRDAVKRGGGAARMQLDSFTAPTDTATDLTAVDSVLREFEAVDPAAAEVVKLRFFAGLNNTQIAEVLGISVRKVGMEWAYAKAWLFRKLEQGRR